MSCRTSIGHHNFQFKSKVSIFDRQRLVRIKKGASSRWSSSLYRPHVKFGTNDHRKDALHFNDSWMIFQSSGLMIPSLHSIERVHPGVKLSMNHPLNTGRRRAEPSCHGIGIGEVPGTDLTLPNSGKGDKQSLKQTKRPNVELSISSIGFR